MKQSNITKRTTRRSSKGMDHIYTPSLRTPEEVTGAYKHYKACKVENHKLETNLQLAPKNASEDL